MLGLIQVESGFRKYAVSPVGARGYTQVMPFWVKSIGSPDQDLFQLRTNLRYGALILRHYIDIERGDLYRALGRYNGSLGQPDYPILSSTRGNATGITPPAPRRQTIAPAPTRAAEVVPPSLCGEASDEYCVTSTEAP